MTDWFQEAKNIRDSFPAGRAMLGPEAGAILMECVAETDGDYIEIGVASAGSLCMAGLTMNIVDRNGLIVGIDPFMSRNSIDSLSEPDKILALAIYNLKHYDLLHRTMLFVQNTPPWPTALQFYRFSVGLIDGNHWYKGPMSDYKCLTERVENYLLFDNVEYEKVQQAVDVAIQSKIWGEHASVEYASNWEPNKNCKFVALRRIN